MRILGLALMSILLTVLLISSTWISVAGGFTGLALVFGAVGTLGSTMGPSMLWNVLGFWDMDRSDASRRSYRRVRMLAVVFTLIGTAGFVAWGVLGGAPWWMTTLFALVGPVWLAVVFVTRGRLQQSAGIATESASAGWRDAGKAEGRRILRAALIVAGISLVITVAAAMVLLAAFVTLRAEWVSILMLALLVAIYAATIPALTGTFRLSRLVRASVGGDVGEIRPIARVVVKGKQEPLSVTQQSMAARYASVVWVQQTVSTACQLPVLALFIAMAISHATDPTPDPTSTLFWACGVALLVVSWAALTPLVVRQIQRSRHYADDHADMLSLEKQAPR